MELSAPTLVFLCVMSLVTVLVSLISRKSWPSATKRRPPGPWRLPFIGSLHHLVTTQPLVALRHLAKKHGPVMYLRLGQIDTVIISTPAAAQDMLRDKDLCFLSRPSLLATEIICYDNVSIAFAPYGAYWRGLRKLCALELLSARKVRQFAPVRDSETLSLVGKVRAAASSGEPVNLGRMIMSCSNGISAKATFGERIDGELQEQFLSAMQVALLNSSGYCVGDLFPSLRFVDVVTGRKRRLQRARGQLDAVFEKIIAGCEERRKEKKKKKTVPASTASTGDDDLLSVMLRIRDEGEHEFPLGTTNIKAIIVDLFTAGTETTSSTAEWVMSELMRHPEAMAKAQAEVREKLDGKKSEDHESQMERLCYTRMVIKETMRLHPPVPLLLPRLCRETCDVLGFEVLEGTRVMVNAWELARSPKHWHDADEFMPERFKDRMAEYNGTQHEFIPFGSGRRMCPGVGYGLATLELVVARLLYYFDWSLPDGMRPDELDMDMTLGSTARRTNQLHLVASPYKVDMEI
uniref:Uncharacterized protein n=1 Tax=Avena sativa TaxID=4498 RepID=A0ACD5YY60_AVESA